MADHNISTFSFTSSYELRVSSDLWCLRRVGFRRVCGGGGGSGGDGGIRLVFIMRYEMENVKPVGRKIT